MCKYICHEGIQPSNLLAAMSLIAGLSIFPSKYSEKFKKYRTAYVKFEICFLLAIYFLVQYFKFVSAYIFFPTIFSIVDFLTQFMLVCTNMVSILFVTFFRKDEFRQFMQNAAEVNGNCKRKFPRFEMAQQNAKFFYMHLLLLIGILTGATIECYVVLQFGYNAFIATAVKYAHMLVPFALCIELAYNCVMVQNYTEYLNRKLYEHFYYISKAKKFTRKNKNMLRALYSVSDTRFFLTNFDTVFDMERNICKLYGVQILVIILLQIVTSVDAVYTLLKTVFSYQSTAIFDSLITTLTLKLVWTAGNLSVSKYLLWIFVYCMKSL